MQPLITKGKREFLGLIAIFFISLLLMLPNTVDDETTGLVMLYSLFLPFFYMTWRRIVLAKWVLTVLLILLAALFLASSIGTDILSMKVTGMLLLLCATGMHAFRGMRAYFGPREPVTTENLETIVEENMLEDLPEEEVFRKTMATKRRLKIPPEDDTVYPSIRRRELSVVIDVLVILIALVLIFNVLGKDIEMPFWLKMTLVFIVLSYEPVLTAFSISAGQKLAGIRIRSNADRSLRIPLYRAYLRFVIKGLLGGISYFTIFSARGRRALHDMAAGSIVLRQDTLKTPGPANIHQNNGRPSKAL